MNKVDITVNWQSIIELGMLIATFLGTLIPLHLHLDSKMERNHSETNALINAIREDMRDFHGRLCAIEEKRKK